MRSAIRSGLLCLLPVAWAGPGPAAHQTISPAPPLAASRHADFKVAVWYRRDRPLETFRYQVYDLRKGEYTRAVDDWLALMKTRFPGYLAVLRDVDLARVKGETELLKVGSIIRQELLAAAAMEGVFLGGAPAGPLRSSLPGPGLPSAPELRSLSTPPGQRVSPSVDLNPPRSSFPVPVPYPRPHP